ncbi:MAG: MATE family efflux transporter [Parasporobacterium sp.]|nr:MATE family efflux transporter [Parasporobacterium sp.]
METQAKKKNSLTEGSVVKGLLPFIIPIIITNLLQALYALADMAIVGNVVGARGMSAINMASLVTAVLLAVATGFTNGGGILISQLFGAGKKDTIQKAMGTTVSAFFLMALLCMAIIYAFGEPILNALSTPPEAFEGAKSYLYICTAGQIFVFVYNTVAADLRSLGKSLQPMIFVAITVVLNVGLDYLFVAVFGWDVEGAALATIISQFISMCCAIAYTKKTKVFDFKPSSLKIDWGLLKTALKIGVFQALQFGITTISFLLISGFVNVYGVAASAATGAAGKIGTFAVLPAQASQVALITFAAQNHVKKQYKRIVKGMLVAMVISLVVAVTLVIVSQANPEVLLRIFTDDPAVIEMGKQYYAVYSLSFLFESLMFCFYGIESGSGYTNFVFFCAIISAIICRLTFAWIFSTFTDLGFIGIAWAYVLAPACSGLAAFIFFLSGKWKKPKLKI